MGVLFAVETGVRVQAADVNQYKEAFEEDHIGDGATNLHKAYIRLGADDEDTNRGITANTQTVKSHWEYDFELGTWGQREEGGAFQPVIGSGYDFISYEQHAELENGVWLNGLADDRFSVADPFFIVGGATTPVRWVLGRRRAVGDPDQVLISGQMGILDMATRIERDDDGNMTFTDAMAGSWKLATLAQGGMERFASPQYSNTVTYDPDTVLATNDLTLGYDAAEFCNYYKWEVAGATLSRIVLVRRVRLPDVFQGWSSIRLKYKAVGDDTLAKVDVSLLDTTNAAATLVGATDLSEAFWDQATIIVSAGTFTPGEYVTLMITLWSKSGNPAFVGDLELNPA